MRHSNRVVALGATLLLSSSVLAHGAAPGEAHVFARQTASRSSVTTATTTATTGPTIVAAAAAVTPTATPTGAPSSSGPSGLMLTSPLSDLATIGTATTSEATMALPSTYAAGAIGPVSGAPPLPAITGLNPANYPALDIHAPYNTPQVLEWINQINLVGAPQIPVNGINGCQNTTFNSAAIANASTTGNCWWTCGGCTRASDISYCPTKNTWGLSYDDGPSPYTPRLLNLLNLANIKTTFFIVGSRAISRPQMLQTEYMEGHQLSVHTWSHPPLTTLSNEQIVAELGWTKKIIKDVTGVTPNTMRPPYGDIDDRVRYISLQMGLTPIIWTSAQGNTFDTRDWQIGSGIVNATAVYNNFENFLTTATGTLASGFIVLAHDLYQQSVELAVDYILPKVINANVIKLQPIVTCLGLDLSQAYIETANNSTSPVETTSTILGASGLGFVQGVASTSELSSYVFPSTTLVASSSSGAASSASGSSTPAKSGSSSLKQNCLSAVGGLVLAGAGFFML